MTTIDRRPTRPTAELETVLDLRDPIGVLSIYADADPTLTGAARPAWQAPVREGIRRVLDEAREGPREARVAVEQRLDGLAQELELLLDPRGPGRGRALFAPISGAEVVRLDLRTPLPSLVHLGARARALPLVEALREGRPGGVLRVGRDRIEILEWELGELEPLDELRLSEPDPEGRGRPGGTNPAVAQPGPERDRFDRARDARLALEVRARGEDLRRVAAERGWDVVLAEGDTRLVRELEPAFAGGASELVQSRRPLARAEQVEEALGEARARERDRLARLLDTSPLVTRGARAVAVALDQGRVDHLLLDPSLPPSAERLLRDAVATSAGVTVTPTRAGAAALLRW